MAKFKYLGTPGAADPKGTDAFGIRFPINQAVEVEDADTVFKLTGHPHFEPADKAAKDAADDLGNGPAGDKAFEGGAKARADGKPRSVPPAYRSKPEEARWLAGFDAEA